MMVEAGLEPVEALTSATAQAAACLGRPDLGVLERGRWADFLVLTEDPLADITATRALEAVYVGGDRIPF
jgi:imidazolonepropionase-like amidohydrolase